MKIERLIEILDADFFTGVPDSQLRTLCDYLTDRYGINPNHHVIAANEGNCTALASGYHLATGKIPVVYMQNSGEGNMINPAVSLLHNEVYGIPIIFIIGWRGEPGASDEPQHIYQGKITIKLLENIDVESFVVDKRTTDEELVEKMYEFRKILSSGRSVALIIRKNALVYDHKVIYENKNKMIREKVIQRIVDISGNDPIISTTGKISRELFEIRESSGKNHKCDFLTVGSMGHCSSIALGVALHKPKAKIWCIDGDGAALMHMGAMAIIGTISPGNLVHIIINNSSHESVGGMPTAAGQIHLAEVARACGYPYAVCINNHEDLEQELCEAKKRSKLSLIEIGCAIGSRDDLGRPTTAALENKQNFMAYLKTM